MQLDLGGAACLLPVIPSEVATLIPSPSPSLPYSKHLETQPNEGPSEAAPGRGRLWVCLGLGLGWVWVWSGLAGWVWSGLAGWLGCLGLSGWLAI